MNRTIGRTSDRILEADLHATHETQGRRDGEEFVV